jgi:hypothetical protein
MSDLPLRCQVASSLAPPSQRRTWFPILTGVLLGMVAWVLLGMLESPSFFEACRL